MLVARRLVIPRRSSVSWAGIAVLMAVLLLQVLLGTTQAPVKKAVVGLPALPFQFVPNVEQVDPSILYTVHTRNGTLYFTPSEVSISLPGRTGTQGDESGSPLVHMRFVGASSAVALQAGDQLPGKVNYLIGNDLSAWKTGIATHSGITYLSLYKGIDLRYEGQNGQLKGTYSLAPHADPASIQWRYAGARQVNVDEQGNVQVWVGSDEQQATITEQAPTASQIIDGRTLPVATRYRVAPDGTIGFTLAGYNSAYPLTIDPALTFSTFLGGSSLDQAMGIATDAAGNIYVAGRAWSTDFPTQNAYQPASAGGNDVFITKIQPGGTVAYSTYLGGGGDDDGNAVAVDATGAVYLTGSTRSTDFPTTPSAYRSTRTSDPSAFMAKLTPDGAGLAYSTYFAGTAFTDAWAVATDGSNGAYIIGRTTSINLPIRNAYQDTYGGVYDVYLARFNTAASGDASLVYSTYLGGNGVEYVGTTGYGLGDWGHGLAVDAAGNAYVAGQTSSANFPVRSAYQPTLNGINDAFVTKVNTSAAGDASLIYSTYLGGTGQDAGKDVDVDAQGNAYVTGEAGTPNFPTLNPYLPCVTGSAFVTKLNPTGSALVYSTCFGSGGRGHSTDIAVDAAGSAYIVGTTSSTTWPTANPIQAALAGSSDAFVVKLTPAGNNVVYSTYLGGSSYEEGIGIAVGGTGGTTNTYVSGDTRSTDFPVQNPIQATCASCPDAADAFISTINESEPAPTSTPTTPPPPTSTATRMPTNTQVVLPSATATNTRVIIPSATPTATFTPVPGDQPPVITVPLNRPYRVGVEIGNYLALRFDASDPDADDTVILSAQGVPSGANFPIPSPGNPIYSTFTWRPTASDIGTYYVTVIATDNHGAQDVATVEIDVVPGCVPYFSDVFTSQYFYDGVRYLFCNYVVTGYLEPDQTLTYRPYSNTSRGQFSKMIALSYHLPPYDPPAPDFTDTPPSYTFYPYIEAAFHAGIITGFPDRTFRGGATITRGQLSKLVVGAAQWPIDTSDGPHFADAQPGSTYYEVIETAFHHGVIGGYACGGPGEECDPQNRPYFRVGNPTTRGQIAKILWQALGSPPAR